MKIELKHIHKRFGPVHANNDINVTFNRGRIIGILGENGAGKSTLMKILSGFQPATSGEIHIDDKLVDYTGPLAAIAHGIGMLQQDPLDVGAFTVLENFIYGRSDGGLFMGSRKARKQLMEITNRLGFELDPEEAIANLSIAQRQQLEIVRLLALGIQTLILDEPTTGISAEQKEMLFQTLRNLAHDDGMIILLVSHKLEDVIALCDEIVVLRAGVMVGELEMPATKSEIVHLMFGQELKPEEREERDLSSASTALELKDVHLSDGRLDMSDLNIQIAVGEVVGLAGLDGSGQELLMRASAGLIRCLQGQVHLAGSDMTGQPYRHYMASGLVFGAAGRIEEGLIAGLTLTEHIALLKEQEMFIDWKRAQKVTQSQLAHYRVKGKPHNEIQELSGGNQQRVLMAMLPENAVALVLEQPTRGLDVDSARWIWQQLLSRRERGSAILFSSADLDELVTYSDRIIVCYAGRIHIIDDPGSITVSELGHFIGGEFPEAIA